ncbi:MAG: phosphotransferase [Gammaproteobacteria bacterium]|nr:phosphotransferase [Gammaproteobacteria bacterium]
MDQRLRLLQPWLQSQVSELAPKSSFVVESLAGDASFRRYFRVVLHSPSQSQQPDSLVLVDAPPPESLEPFVSLAIAYQEQGVRTPKILATDAELGVILLEDFGNRLFADNLSMATALPRYQTAIELLPQIMAVKQHRQGAIPDYDRALLQRENSLFTDWLLQEHLGLELSAAEQALWQQVNELLIENALAQPQLGVHRDYHSRNLMLLAEPLQGGRDLGVIDFQDAVRGPITYDLVSLLRDCYVVWPRDWVLARVEEAYALLQSEGLIDGVSRQQFLRWFDLMGLQRHTKASGIFARLYHRDGKAGYLADVPRTVQYLVDVSADYPELADYHDWLKTRIQPAIAAKAAKTEHQESV